MKTQIKILIAACAVLVSFAFITVKHSDIVHRTSGSPSETQPSIQSSERHTPMSGYALEDEDQWN